MAPPSCSQCCKFAHLSSPVDSVPMPDRVRKWIRSPLLVVAPAVLCYRESMTTTLTDLQMAGLLDLVISQERDLIELQSSVFALAKIAYDLSGGQIAETYPQYKQQFRTEATNRGVDERIELLESMSLQLKQSGRPIQ